MVMLGSSSIFVSKKQLIQCSPSYQIHVHSFAFYHKESNTIFPSLSDFSSRNGDSPGQNGQNFVFEPNRSERLPSSMTEGQVNTAFADHVFLTDVGPRLSTWSPRWLSMTANRELTSPPPTTETCFFGLWPSKKHTIAIILYRFLVSGTQISRA